VFLDITILLQTVQVILWGKGARWLTLFWAAKPAQTRAARLACVYVVR
jgi:hypothetical protein